MDDPRDLMSPGGFVFGVQGWTWGEPRPTSITFFIDGTAMVCDQHGRPIKGTSVDGKEVKFAITPPLPPQGDGTPTSRPHIASHMATIAALEAENINWQKLTSAGWPQLPYEKLKELQSLPPTPIDELRKIRDPKLRQDALKIRKECDERVAKELQVSTKEE